MTTPAIDPLEQAAADAGVSKERLLELLERDQQMAESQAAAKRARVDGPSGTQLPLPPGWAEAKDPRYGNTTYWYHRDTKETTWTRPAGAVQPAGPRPGPSGGSGPCGRPQGSHAPVGSSGQSGYGPAACGHAGHEPPGCGPSPSNPMIELQLDEWVAAKRAKDFTTADRIRSELRAIGCDPAVARPQHMGQPRAVAGFTGTNLVKLLPGAMVDDAMHVMLEAWVKAKREKDYGKADLIRHDIRDAGYDPDSWWPMETGPPVPQAGYGAGLPHPVADETVMAAVPVPAMPDGVLRVNMSAGGQVHGGGEPPVSSTHMALQAWVEAKRTRDFDEADRIREAMLAQGVDPSKILPKWGRWSSRERQLREIAENKRVH